MNDAKDETVLDHALARLRALTGLDVAKADCGGKIIVKHEVNPGLRFETAIPVQLCPDPQDAQALIAERARHPEPPVFVMNKLARPLARDLRRAGVEHLDTAGNVLIKRLPIFLKLAAEAGGAGYDARLPGIPGLPTAKYRAFKGAGLRLIFGLLNTPDPARATYRELAERAGVAIGTVHKVMKELVELGYLQVRGTAGRVLIRKPELVDRWAGAFALELVPGLRIGRYRALEPPAKWWRTIEIGKLGGAWGGAPAGALLTGNLEPRDFLIYTYRDPLDLARQLRLIPDPAGTVELRRAFWNPEATPVADVCPPLIAYADLMATREPRHDEIARTIHEQHLV